MFQYEKKLQYPVRIKTPNPKLAAWVISQYGGPDGELGASLRYLSQRYAMPYPELKGLLTDIGTEELGHLEMIGAIVHQLTRGLTQEQLREGGFAPYFVDHTAGVYPTAASGAPWNAASIGVKGDVICDLTEDMAAEQKARVTYDNILRLSDDPDVSDVIRFLREREVVHFQRFGEANREDCSKIPKARKAHKFSAFGKSLSIRTFAGHRHEPPYLLLYLKMKIIHEIGQAAFSYN
nr:manganese catalase family protein [uncultured Flavonifractor sp.]